MFAQSLDLSQREEYTAVVTQSILNFSDSQFFWNSNLCYSTENCFEIKLKMHPEHIQIPNWRDK